MKIMEEGLQTLVFSIFDSSIKSKAKSFGIKVKVLTTFVTFQNLNKA